RRSAPSGSWPGSRESCPRSSPRTPSPGCFGRPNPPLALRIRPTIMTSSVSAAEGTKTSPRPSRGSVTSVAETSVTGASGIAEAFAGAREQGRAALMPYLMGGFPDTETALAVAGSYADAGADLIELGVPFSDPLADGPVIHAAATRALAAGATLERVLSICERLAERLPVVPMVYANMVLARGTTEFAGLLADAGAAGVIVPDLPVEEAGEIGAELGGAGISLVPL